MKTLINIIIIIIISVISNLIVVNAKDTSYKQLYLNYLDNKNNEDIRVVFYDINNDNIPEMILNESLLYEQNINKTFFNNVYHIYTIKNDEIKEIFNIENETYTLVQEPITFFVTNNDNNLYYGVQDNNLYNNINYYRLDYDKGEITSSFVGKIESDFFENLYLNIFDNFNEKFYIKENEVSESEFIQKINFKQTLSFINIKNIQSIKFAIDNFNFIPANPTIDLHTHEIQTKPNGDYIGIESIIYNNGMYDKFKLNSDKDLLMIYGNILPKTNIYKEHNIIYLPLRVVCNYINKEVNYNNQDNTITLDNMIIDLNKNKIVSTNQSLNIKNLNNSIYLSLDFFEKYLNFNVNTFKEYNINIIALESKNISLDYTSNEKAQRVIINSVKQNNKEDIYKLKHIIKKQDLGRYYVFEVEYLYIPFKNQNRILTLLYDKYSNKIFKLSGGIKECYDNNINLY